MFLHRAYFFSTYSKNIKTIKEIFLFICIPFEREGKKRKKRQINVLELYFRTPFAVP